jgi:hypothetical protein
MYLCNPAGNPVLCEAKGRPGRLVLCNSGVPLAKGIVYNQEKFPNAGFACFQSQIAYDLRTKTQIYHSPSAFLPLCTQFRIRTYAASNACNVVSACN